jgi:hypothetical protein
MSTAHVDRAENLRAADQVAALAGLRATPADGVTRLTPPSGSRGGGLD